MEKKYKTILLISMRSLVGWVESLNEKDTKTIKSFASSSVNHRNNAFLFSSEQDLHMCITKFRKVTRHQMSKDLSMSTFFSSTSW